MRQPHWCRSRAGWSARSGSLWAISTCESRAVRRRNRSQSGTGLPACDSSRCWIGERSSSSSAAWSRCCGSIRPASIPRWTSAPATGVGGRLKSSPAGPVRRRNRSPNASSIWRPKPAANRRRRSGEAMSGPGWWERGGASLRGSWSAVSRCAIAPSSGCTATTLPSTSSRSASSPR